MEKATLVVTKGAVSQYDLIYIEVILQSTECDPLEDFMHHSTGL